jgi:hypothetical protein
VKVVIDDPRRRLEIVRHNDLNLHLAAAFNNSTFTIHSHIALDFCCMRERKERRTPLNGSDSKRQLDPFLTPSQTTKRSGKHNWANVQVIGELKRRG